MSDYTIQLADGRKLQFSISVPKYPFVQNIIGDIKSADETIFLPYPDNDALYEVLTTDFMHIKHPFLHFIRLIKAIDYLGSVDILDQMLMTVNEWFNTPAIEQLRQNKEETINAILGLSPVIQDSLMYIMGMKPYTAQLPPRTPATINISAGSQVYVSPNLNYIVTNNNLFLTPNMLYRGEMVPFPLPDIMAIVQNKFAAKPIQDIIISQSVVTNLGDYYMGLAFRQLSNSDELFGFTIVIKYSKEKKYEVGEVFLDSEMTANGVLLSTNPKRYFIPDSKLKQGSIRDISELLRDISELLIFNGSAPSKEYITIPTPNNRATLRYIVQGNNSENETNCYHITYTNNYINREIGKHITIFKGNVTLLVNDMFGVLYDDLDPRGDYLIFSYAEDKWIEIFSVNSRNISEELGIFMWENKISIISNTGQVIAEIYMNLRHSLPIGLSDKYLIALDYWASYQVEKEGGVKMVACPIIKFFPIVNGHISDKAERELRVPIDLVMEKRKISLDWVFPGTNDTFLFIYSVDDGYYVVKYSIYDGKTLEEYLRDKL